jgi:hypothetical protein
MAALLRPIPLPLPSLTGHFRLALLNAESACLAYLGVVHVSLLWRVELNSVWSRLDALEEGIARAGGGRWEDLYIKVKRPGFRELFDKVLFRLEPLIWTVVAISLIVANASAILTNKASAPPLP